MRPFTYHKPASVAAAEALLAGNAEARILAGGMSMLPTMKMHLAQPEALIDLAAIAGLDGIGKSRSTLTVGAMTKHAAVAGSGVVRSLIPALAELAAGIGDPAVRNRGTIGGSIANNDPAADYPAAVLGLGATIVTSAREIAADAFFQGLFQTALEPEEIVTSIRFPLPLAAAYAKFRSPGSRFALVGVFVARFRAGTRVAVTGAGSCVFRSTELEAALSKSFEPAAIENARMDPAGLNSDIHAAAAYRAHLIVVMAKRAVARAKELASQRS